MFIGEPEYKIHPHKKGFLVISTGFIYKRADGDFFEAKVGDATNGASVPWIFQLFFNRLDHRYSRSVDMHDILVGEGQRKGLATINGETRHLTWRESAKWLRDGMLEEGSNKFLSILFYEAVMIKKRPKQLIKNLYKKILGL